MSDLTDRFNPALGPGAPIAKLSFTHEAMIDLMIAQPGLTNQQLAEAFGYKSGAWISTIKGSDIFQAKLAERNTQMADPVLRMELEERLRSAGKRALEKIMERMEETPSEEFLLGTAKLAAQAYGARQATSGPQVVIQIGAPVKSEAEWVERHRPKAQAAEVEVLDRVPVPLPIDHERR